LEVPEHKAANNSAQGKYYKASMMENKEIQPLAPDLFYFVEVRRLIFGSS
jgi:hypothetical protein